MTSFTFHSWIAWPVGWKCKGSSIVHSSQRTDCGRWRRFLRFWKVSFVKFTFSIEVHVCVVNFFFFFFVLALNGRTPQFYSALTALMFSWCRVDLPADLGGMSGKTDVGWSMRAGPQMGFQAQGSLIGIGSYKAGFWEDEERKVSRRHSTLPFSPFQSVAL